LGLAGEDPVEGGGEEENKTRRWKMPLGDGTGPLGLGPMTGRAAGFCAGFGRPGFTNPIPGRWFGWWWRIPYGYPYAGFGYPYYSPFYAPFYGFSYYGAGYVPPYGYPGATPPSGAQQKK